MKVYVVIYSQALMDEGDDFGMLGVFFKKEDAREVMIRAFKEKKYDEDLCEDYEIEENRIYAVGENGFSYDHYWVEIVEQEVK